MGTNRGTMQAFKDPKFDKGVKKEISNPFKPQPTYDSKKRMFMGGDYYGTGYKQPMGKMRGENTGLNPIPQKKLATDPRSLG